MALSTVPHSSFRSMATTREKYVIDCATHTDAVNGYVISYDINRLYVMLRVCLRDGPIADVSVVEMQQMVVEQKDALEFQ